MVDAIGILLLLLLLPLVVVVVVVLVAVAAATAITIALAVAVHYGCLIGCIQTYVDRSIDLEVLKVQPAFCAPPFSTRSAISLVISCSTLCR